MIKTKPEADPMRQYGATETAALLEISRQKVYKYLKGHIDKSTGHKVFTGQEILDYWSDMLELLDDMGELEAYKMTLTDGARK